MSSPTELRSLAADCVRRARLSNPSRAAQLRQCAKEFRRQAREQLLFEHCKALGRSNVTSATFREHLRAARA